MRTITLKLPDGLAARVSAAVKRGSSTSALVREAIADHFDSSEDDRAGSCFDLASDLCGSLTGPADLSSNPKHLKGYGR